MAAPGLVGPGVDGALGGHETDLLGALGFDREPLQAFVAPFVAAARRRAAARWRWAIMLIQIGGNASSTSRPRAMWMPDSRITLRTTLTAAEPARARPIPESASS